MTLRQICSVFGVVLLVSLIGSSRGEEIVDNAVNAPGPNTMPPLALISEQPMSMAKTMSRVPLVPVPQKDLVVMKSPEITAMSSDNTLVQCFNEQTGLTEAMPAVKLHLKTPVVINSRARRAVIDFPSFVNVVHRGSLVPLPVGALIAPISYQRLSQPLLVKTVYAVPTFPINYQYAAPLAPATAYSRPYLFQPYPLNYNFYNQLQPYVYRPYGLQPISDAVKPAALAPAVSPATIKQPSQSQPLATPQVGPSQPERPLVTVLDFPESVASPSVLYYQPPISSDSEFENREPPQPVIPAGIVQSTAPQTNQQLFLNSKESVYLLSIKDDLKKRL